MAKFAFNINVYRLQLGAGSSIRVSEPRVLATQSHLRRVEAALLGCRGRGAFLLFLLLREQQKSF